MSIVEALAREEQFLIGSDAQRAAGGTDANLIGVIVREDLIEATGVYGLNPIFGLVENFSAEDFVFSAEQSSDNGVADAWVAANMRIGGAAVATVTVVPGGQVVFVIEGTTEQYLKFEALPTVMGRLTLISWFRPVGRRDRTLTP